MAQVKNKYRHLNRVSIKHFNHFSMTFQEHAVKLQFGKIANLKSITMNNWNARTHSMQLHRQIAILLNIVVFYVKLLLKYRNTQFSNSTN